MGRGGRAAERWAFGRGDRGSNHLLPFKNLGNFVHPTLPVSFGRDTKKLLVPSIYDQNVHKNKYLTAKP